MELDVERVVGLRVELGSGGYPSPGYLHIDIKRASPELHYVAPVWDLPFRDGSVDELLAIHVLEHVPPGRLVATLREWRRVLRPGGFATIHVPDGRALARAFLERPAPERWAIGSAIVGSDGGPETRSPSELDQPNNIADHQVVFDSDLLDDALRQGGFTKIEDLTGLVSDRHTEAWTPIVPHISLVARAHR
jgi:ubiquinone/menaquinone biosynthesis C-methylase UbiE